MNDLCRLVDDFEAKEMYKNYEEEIFIASHVIFCCVYKMWLPICFVYDKMIEIGNIYLPNTFLRQDRHEDFAHFSPTRSCDSPCWSLCGWWLRSSLPVVLSCFNSPLTFSSVHNCRRLFCFMHFSYGWNNNFSKI